MMNRGNMGRQIETAPASRVGMGKPMPMKKGGSVKGYAKGGMASRGDGCCMKGKTKGALK